MVFANKEIFGLLNLEKIAIEVVASQLSIKYMS
jgi:hypothetical protein